MPLIRRFRLCQLSAFDRYICPACFVRHVVTDQWHEHTHRGVSVVKHDYEMSVVYEVCTCCENRRFVTNTERVKIKMLGWSAYQEWLRPENKFLYVKRLGR